MSAVPKEDVQEADYEVLEETTEPAEPARAEPSSTAMASRVTAEGVALIAHEPVPLSEFLEKLADPATLEEQKALMAAYDNAVEALVGPNDAIEEGGRRFKKKSAWRKLSRYFHISTQVVSSETRWVDDWNPVSGEVEKHFVADVVVRGIAPWGQYMEASASCSTAEARFQIRGLACPTCGGKMWDNRKEDSWPNDFRCGDCGTELMQGDYDPDDADGQRVNPQAISKARHDCIATAETRATNRATSSLIAAGEVSWEEAQGGDQRSYGGGGRKRSSKAKAPPKEFRVSDKIGRGKHADLTWAEAIKQKPGYFRNYILTDKCRWVPRDAKAELGGLMPEAPRGDGARSPGAAEQPGAIRDKWIDECVEAGWGPDDMDAYAVRDAKVPNALTDWRPQHYAHALDRCRRAGYPRMLEALRKPRPTQAEPSSPPPPPEKDGPPPIPGKLRGEAWKLLKDLEARRAELPEGIRDDLETYIEEGDRKNLETLVDDLRALAFASRASSS